MLDYDAPEVRRVVTARGQTPAVLELTIEGESLGRIPRVHVAPASAASSAQSIVAATPGGPTE